MRTFLKRFSQDQSGVSAMEYGIIAAVIVLFMVPAITGILPKLQQVFSATAQNTPVD